MAVESQNSVVIDRPIEDVFRLTNDDVSKWSTITVEDVTLDEKPGMVGTTFRIVTEEKGRRMEFDGVVQEWNPPRLSASHLTGKSFDITVRYEFEDLGGTRTKVTQHATIQPKGGFKIVFALLGWAFRKANCDAQDKEFQSLKRFCEENVPAPAASGEPAAG